MRAASFQENFVTQQTPKKEFWRRQYFFPNELDTELWEVIWSIRMKPAWMGLILNFKLCFEIALQPYYDASKMRR